MANTMAPQSSGVGGAVPTEPGHGSGEAGHDPSKRDFLILVTSAFAAVGVGAMAWPFISQMNPAQDVLALSTTEADLAPVAVGASLTVMWRGKPVFIRHRTPKEIEEARAVQMSQLPDPATDQSRVQKAEWLVVVGVCTHLGCVPLGQKTTDPRGLYDGWFCPCHGSMYDTSGRIRQGPAPSNLPVPQYTFTSEKQIKIG